ncbi:MAG: pyruvate ferredoxin oxidoreductase [Deltaproteobacteria bacterium RBG_16_49_23]|nr:MAG: pyruvate ferredoxin oxidoreductase [Deltaproteobacteria bacterium RBG_16_49_23]
MRRVITGNQAVAYGVILSRVDVVSAYPITPQTTIVEELSELIASGRLKTRFLKVESEHSAMAALIGASTGGVRTFTATSSHGLAYMHEMLHWASGARLPIVLVNVNRAIGPPWNIWGDQSDSVSQRDTGWIQLYCENNQEVLDTILQAYLIAETVRLPVMVVLDAFVLSHTAEPVEIPSIEEADSLLPPFCPDYPIDTQEPRSYSVITTPDYFLEFRYKVQKAMEEVPEVAKKVDDEFRSRFGRSYGAIERYGKKEAELLLMTSGTVTSTSRIVIKKLMEKGLSVAGIKIKRFRPFPSEEICEVIQGAKKIAVIDRNLSAGVGGIFAQELRASLYSREERPQVFGFVSGLGGRDITPALIEEAVQYTVEHPQPEGDILWLGLKK